MVAAYSFASLIHLKPGPSLHSPRSRFDGDEEVLPTVEAGP